MRLLCGDNRVALCPVMHQSLKTFQLTLPDWDFTQSPDINTDSLLWFTHKISLFFSQNGFFPAKGHLISSNHCVAHKALGVSVGNASDLVCNVAVYLFKTAVLVFSKHCLSSSGHLQLMSLWWLTAVPTFLTLILHKARHPTCPKSHLPLIFKK